MNLNEARQTLSRVGWLGQTPVEFRRAVLSRCVLVSYRPGQSVYHPSDDSSGIFGLASGGAIVSVYAADREPIAGHFMQPGAWYGDNAFANAPRTIGVTAARSSYFLFISSADINAVVESNWQFWSHFAALSIVNADTAVSVAFDLMIRSDFKRCCATLLRLGNCRFGPNPVSEQPEINITQVELARMANLSRNAVGNYLKRLAENQVVISTHRKFQILQDKMLRQMIRDVDD